ncbi:hypothetical protein [Xanthomonas vesicatoria]|uniref:hypothetical protein n=1 Tax=Xanthomonas vesicatoria TaxID=56460 RepID=UPI00073BF7E2|nr:hypothetical protein [Xanthomonas vesicatoria]KTF35318.1 hypothetical protein LMG919_13690 [Xanthomonas vesicatoria]MCC8557430.1 hypothetical protein [Xanthomonas vesicatoria]MCC8600848.1 hypothetical protein [Xanthomonas vesicatoria]MCC8610786.1 hypothetical protein [Xanthomonas vesicatoria]MCC8673716.1 hypothetical protein [Xanthomonas vesicatoria]
MLFKDIGYRYRNGAVRYGDLAYVLCIDPDLEADGLPHTAFYAWDGGGWGMYEIGRWNAHSICVTQRPKDQAIALGEHGTVRVMGNDDDYDEQIACHGVSLSVMREIHNVGGFAYVCGMDRQVFKRESPGNWIALHGDMPTQPAKDMVFGFESIHGYSEVDVYTVGWHGEIWHFDGAAWTRCASPTAINLTRVCCAEDGWVYACGMQGMLLRGKHDRWEIICQAATDADLWDLEWFGGRLYVATRYALYWLHDDRLELVDVGDAAPITCYSISSADGLLWSIGENDIVAFDGSTWRHVE